MCGIVGHISYTHLKPEEEKLRNATDTLVTRGPDDVGIWCSEHVGFGHRRLSILDLSSAGHQPMLSEDGRYAIIHNGEIYNFKELKKRLSNNGRTWKSNSDTEVILAAYSHWGTECVEKFHGMFAFAIWDTKEKTLFVARDRMGVKPFYYYHGDGCFAFASRPRAIFEIMPSLSRQIDVLSVGFFLQAGYIPAEKSIYTDIRKLPPAHYIVFRQDGVRVVRYWDFRNIRPDSAWNDRSEEDLMDELDELLGRCVSSRMISDVPLGAFLSGGIDSSIVVSKMAGSSTRAVKTFTIGFEDQAYDESRYAKEISIALDCEHHATLLKADDLLDLMPTYLEAFDEPFFDYSAFPVMAVSRMTRDKVTVSLSGDGGDELFGGYHYYQIVNRLQWIYGIPIALRQAASKMISLFPQHRIQLIANAVKQDNMVSAFAFMRSIVKDFKNPVVEGGLEKSADLSSLFMDCAEKFPDDLSIAEKSMRLDAYFTLPDDYLQKVDIGSMAFSLEVRNPMLDQDIVEWAMKLPLKFKLRNGCNKYLLRKLAYRYLPQKLLNRPKQGFEIPMADWLRRQLKTWAMERLNEDRLYTEVPLDKKIVLDLWKLHLTGKRNVHSLLWAILMLLDFADKK